jgi:hypothetical protein
MARSETFLPSTTSIMEKPADLLPGQEDFGFDGPLPGGTTLDCLDLLDIDADADTFSGHEDFGFDGPMPDGELLAMDAVLGGMDDAIGMF